MDSVLLGLALLGGASLGILGRRLRTAAAPDEWMIHVRRGRLVKAGVGITVWRRPGDAVARFTSTLQRVSFASEGLSAERLPVQVQGHVFWGVAEEGEGPFQAYRTLGLGGAETGRHLLSRAQHHAFQQLVAAEVQRLLPAHSLAELLSAQDALVAEASARLAELHGPMGVRVERVEILQVRPVDEGILRSLGVEEAETLRAEAGRRRLETDRALRAQEAEMQRERALAEEEGARQLEQARLARETDALEARLALRRREAEADRDATLVRAEAEERKSPALREAELRRFVAERAAEALGRLQEARWVTVGPENPWAGLAAGLSLSGKEE